MSYWDLGLVSNLLGLVVSLAVAAWLPRRLSWLRRLAIPDAFLAGALALAVGPGGFGVAPLDTATLEAIVYHSFGLMFIAVALQRPPGGAPSPGVRTIALAIPTTAILQILVGFLLVGLLAILGARTAHPGFALLGMLGFGQGPGQALSLGNAWTPLGLADGAQLGLGFAASGFVFCGLVGVPMVAWGRRRGWLDTPADTTDDPDRPGVALDQPPSV